MQSQGPSLQWTDVMPCEIVEKGFRKMRILVFTGPIEEDSLRIIVRSKKLHVYATSIENEKCMFCTIPIGFKPKEINYTYKNGVLTIDLKKKIFFLF
ncbi:hypothetical protein J4526_04600 [Desulfurococcaceae archaeon MEX13E-LK6-19]|nr:hypothetical protein J4526_04600 [Desulfurococcaceae archaeon MEX13E-LK6-19]